MEYCSHSNQDCPLQRIGNNIIFPKSIKGMENLHVYKGEKTMHPVNFSYLRTICSIIFFFAGVTCSFLRAQKYDPELIGRSFILPCNR